MSRHLRGNGQPSDGEMRLSWDALGRKTLCFCRGQRRGEIGCASRLLEYDRRTERKELRGQAMNTVVVTCFVDHSMLEDEVGLRHTRASFECDPPEFDINNRIDQYKRQTRLKKSESSSSCSSSETQPLQLINAQFPGTRVPSLASPVPYQGLRTWHGTWDTNGDPRTGESPEIRLGP
jgi:hypothetical protein